MAHPTRMIPMQWFDTNLRDEHVTIVVGKGNVGKDFSILMALLCESSSWFVTALEEDRFKEGVIEAITLLDESPAAFQAFRYYAYFRDLAFPNINTTEVLRELKYCIGIWLFGDKYNLANLQTEACCGLATFSRPLRARRFRSMSSSTASSALYQARRCARL